MIYLKLKDKPKTISELLKELFSYYNSNMMRNVTTYKDEECTIIQCNAGRNRSYDDIEEIVNTYFPNTDAKVIIHELLILDIRTPSNTELYFFMMFCSDIKKYVCLYNPELAVNPDPFNLKGDSSISKYSWASLLGMLGVENQYDLKAYIKKHKPGTGIILPEDLKIKDLASLYKEMGITTPSEQWFPYIEPGLRRKSLLQYQINLLVKYFNKDWKPDWKDSNQRKWYPYFSKGASGWVFGGSDFFGDFCFGRVGLYQSKEIADHIGTYFKDIYTELAEC